MSDESKETLASVIKAVVRSFASETGDMDSTPASQVQPVSGDRMPATANLFLEPKLANPEGLSVIATMSNGLRRIRDAMASNLHSAGVRLEPKIDPDWPHADKLIAAEIVAEKAHAFSADRGEEALSASPDEIEKYKQHLRRAMMVEHARITNFLANCLPVDISFVEHNERTAFDKHGCGQSGWELIRRPADRRTSPLGMPARLNLIPGWTIKLRRMDPHETPVWIWERVSQFKRERVREGRRFRIFGHVVRAKVSYYKQIGDPRWISQENGDVLKSPCWICADGESIQTAQCDVCHGTGIYSNGARERRSTNGHLEPLANEMYFWSVWDPIDEYGVPEWFGCFYEALGSIQVGKLNYDWFRAGTFDVSVIKAWGLTVQQATLDKLNADVNAVKGSENQGRFVLLEGQPVAGMDPTKQYLEIEPLAKGRGSDALYQSYDKNNREKLRETARLPETILGETKHATGPKSASDLQVAEAQVIGPKRAKWDNVFNSVFMAELGILHWNVVSNAPSMTDPDTLAKTLALLVNANVITIAEAREHASGIVGQKFEVLAAQWTKEPNNLLLAKLQNLGNMLKQGYTLEQSMAAINAMIDGTTMPTIGPPEIKSPAPASGPPKNGQVNGQAQPG